MSTVFRSTVTLALGWALIAWLAPATASPPSHAVSEATVRAYDPVNARVEVDSPADRPVARRSRLLVADGIEPLALLAWSGQAAGRALFRGSPANALPHDLGGLRAWLIRPDAVGLLLDRWPADGALVAQLDRIGPGARSAWVRAGGHCGVRNGDSWWLRRNGQPIARFDVRLVEPEISFCAVVPLAAELRLTGGERLALWPAPGRRARGQARSAVAFVAPAAQDQLVWVAAPPKVDCPSIPRVEFYRGGRYIASGIADRQDDRFWYVRVPLAAGTVAVGDQAAIRTRSDIVHRRFTARVFEATSEGFLITAGESDELAPGDTASAARAGRALGRVVVRRVQRSYAVVRPVAGRRGVDLRVGDELRFAAPPGRPRRIATVTRVVAEHLFSAQLESALAAPPHTPLAIRVAGNTIGVGVLLVAEGGAALGLVFEASQTAPLSVGAELVWEETPAR